MNCENYLKFVKSFVVYNQHPELHIESEGQTWEHFEGHISVALKEAKIFEIDNETKKMLILTKTPNKNDAIKLPFPYIFLDVNFKREELAQLGIKIDTDEICGIVLSEGELIFDKNTCNKTDEKYKHLPKVIGKSLRISTFSIRTFKGKEECWFNTFSKNVNLIDEAKDFNIKVKEVETSDKKASKFIHLFCLNFLNFLHNPEVEYVQHIRSEKNLKRKQEQGKIAIKESYSIKLTGVLKKYVDEIRSLGHFDGRYSYRFWVRGHFRRLVSDFYKQKKIIWIPPYIKGKGVLVEKFYKVEEKQDGV